MEPALISIIVPVYNVEQKLGRCVEAIRNQSYAHWQLLLIDDGSRDNSLAVCRGYAVKDSRIAVYSQTNGGPGAARNTGLGYAQGEYLLFCDSDDILLEEALVRLASAIQDSDLVIAHYQLCQNDFLSDRGLNESAQTVDRQAFLAHYAKYPGSFYYSALWNKLYRRDLVQSHGLRFETAYSWGEDFIFNTRYNALVQRVHYIDEMVYRYNRTTKGQTWRTLFEVRKGLRTKKRLYQALKALYVQEGLYHRYRYYIDRYIFNITLFN